MAPLYPAGGDTAPNGTRYVADSGRSRIVTITANGRQHVVRSPGAGWKDPRDLTVDSGNARKLWILDTGNDRVVRLDTVHGDQEKVFGGLTEPYGVSDDNSGLYVADTYANRVVKLAKGSGNELWASNGSGCSATLFDRPRDVAVGSNGDIYVADTDNDRIVRLDASNGDCVAEFGVSGTANGQLDAPRSIAATSGGLWISEGQAARVQRFRNNGNYVQGSSFGSFGTGRNRFRSPHCVFMDGRLLAVCDTFNFRIQRLRVAGGDPRYHSTLGGTRPAKGGFNGPFDVVYGPGGVMYVTDWFNHRIEKFNANGSVDAAWGGYGTPAGSFIFPRGIAVMDDGDGRRHRQREQPPPAAQRRIRARAWASSDPSVRRSSPGRTRPPSLATTPSGWRTRGTIECCTSMPSGTRSRDHRAHRAARDRRGRGEHLRRTRQHCAASQRRRCGPQDTIAGFGIGQGQVRQPYGLRIATIHGQQVLLVADRGNNRVQIFDLATGNFLQSLSGGLTQPQGMDARNNGRIAVANFGRNRVSLWNS